MSTKSLLFTTLLLSIIGCCPGKRSPKTCHPTCPKASERLSSVSTFDSEIDGLLMAAVQNNDTEKAAHMLTQGANVNMLIGHNQPHWGYTPLAIAIKNGSLPMTQLLINAGANVNEFTDTNGITGKHEKIKDNVRNNSLLSYAIILNNPAMVTVLLDNGADAPMPDPIMKKWTPLMIAQYNGRDEIVAILKKSIASMGFVQSVD